MESDQPTKNGGDAVEAQRRPDARMEILRDWLKKEFWNFNLGRLQFDRHSEGYCILAGIDPERSMETDSEYGPYLLCGTLESFGLEDLGPSEEWQLRQFFDDYIDDLKSLGLKGRVHCHEAIRVATEKGLEPPWLKEALADEMCSKHLPAEMLDVSDEPKSAVSRAASKKRRDAWANDERTKKLIEVGMPVFRRNREALVNRKLSKAKLAQIVHDALVDEDETLEHLQPRTIVDHIGKWLKED